MGKLVFISLFVAALSALFGERIMNIRKRALASRELVQNHLPNCVLLKNLDYGSEDITILPNGIALISAGLKYPGMPSFSDGAGKIFSLDLQDTRLKPMELRMPRNFDLNSFNPHGISVFIDPSDDTIYLFVVSHPRHEGQFHSQMEIFKFVEEDHSLVYLKTVKHELLHSVNDIVAVGVDSFYATNDHYFSHEILRLIETFLSLPWGNVVYYSPGEVKVVSDRYYFANGINLSPDKRHLYVVDLFDHNVHVLERQADNTLVSVKSVAVGSLCDNVEVEPETGDLWLGCHPNGWKALVYNPEDPPGSEVIQIQNIHSEQPVVTQVYADNGSVIIGSSVAAPFGGKLLIGTVFHKALCCDLK
ncbi:serum paraoxonase/arylesterase 2-like [Myripristis murdjan]|uniref:Paraoxonase n=1 Tax=Myripristis murdjan TaxID=586833 RepID=A0A667XUJ4_9TELE|nr:serum paraoxonase/arylesterase 2-like [Myripristis murdjan]